MRRGPLPYSTMSSMRILPCGRFSVSDCMSARSEAHFVVAQLVAHEDEGAALPVADEVALLGQVALLDDAFALVVERAQLVDHRAQLLRLARWHLDVEPLVLQRLLRVVALRGVDDLAESARARLRGGA